MQPTTDQVVEWITEASRMYPTYGRDHQHLREVAGFVAYVAFAAGADSELKASCEALEKGPYGASCAANGVSDWLRNTRRPGGASLKKEALESLDKALTMWMTSKFDIKDFVEHGTRIRKALEAMPDG